MWSRWLLWAAVLVFLPVVIVLFFFRLMLFAVALVGLFLVVGLIASGAGLLGGEGRSVPPPVR